MGDLFASISDNPRYVRARDRSPRLRAALERYWELLRPVGDPNFLSQFPGNFAARSWELRVCALLTSGGHTLLQGGSQYPDFRIAGSPEIWVEATIVEPNEMLRSVQDARVSWGPNPSDILERYAHAIRKKAKQHQQRLRKRLVAVDQPFIIALNAGEIRDALYNTPPGEFPDIVRGVLGLSEPVLRIGATGPTLETRFCPTRTTSTGKVIRTNTFLQHDNPHAQSISAILFTACDTPTCFDDVGADLVFAHNPMAIAPLPTGWLKKGREYWVDGNSGELMENRFVSSGP